jgi:eukaryotic-like serine/threonine-protein kinase
MALTAGTRLGQYEILAAIGEGGMGEVYRARDRKLGRDVAIKVLPDVAIGTPERAARFEREAQLLAALNHPHIATLYGFEETASGHFLVLELIDGESLADRIAASPGGLPVAETLRIAGQIIDALEAAHEKGIIHRDLKPGNIMLTSDGQVKVLDFGLARATEGEAAASVSNSPTLSLAATQAGVVLGTAAYMSPEQSKGRVADKRTDVWAFGCVLYEMLTGRRAFEGEDVSETLAAILRGEPDWSAIPPAVPPRVVEIIKRCLAREKKARIPDISVVRYLLNEAPAAAAPQTPAIAASADSRGRRIAAGLLWFAGGVALAAIAWLAASRVNRAPAPQAMRLAIVTPATHAIAASAIDRVVALSPDGMVLAYIGRAGSTGDNQLMIRRLDQAEPTAVPNTLGARYPFFSADGRWIAFFMSGELKKVAHTGGAPTPICRTVGGIRGGAWNASNTIVFATNDPGTGLLTVPASGGEPKVVTKGSGLDDHFQPSFLPDGRHVLFTIHKLGVTDAAQVAIVDIGTGEWRVIVPSGSNAEYVDPGFLIYAQAGTLYAVRFDAHRNEIVGDAVAVEDRVLTLPTTDAANFAVSRSGHAAFVPGAFASTRRTVTWTQRDGTEEPVGAEPRVYSAARLSPDGTRIALEARDAEQDIWIYEIGRRTSTKLTFDPTLDAMPTWTPDGKHVVFQSGRTGVPNLFMQAADGTGKPVQISSAGTMQTPYSISPDGRELIAGEMHPTSGPDLVRVALGVKTDTTPVLATTAAETNGELSPDGKWLAYQVVETGTPQVFVRPYPRVDDGRWQISAAGGTRPVWTKNGKELIYLDLNRAMISVPVETSKGFRAGDPVKLFEKHVFTGVPQRTFDVTPDGSRFVMIKDPDVDQGNGPPAIVFVLNWIEEVKARLGIK